MPIGRAAPGRDEREADLDLARRPGSPGSQSRRIEPHSARATTWQGRSVSDADLDVAGAGGRRGAGSRRRAPTSRQEGGRRRPRRAPERGSWDVGAPAHPPMMGSARHGPVIACRYPAATMMERFKAFWPRSSRPFAHLLIRLGRQPRRRDRGRHPRRVRRARWSSSRRASCSTGVLVITAFVFSDLIDGYMARLTGRTLDKFGAFLDSTLDRIGDGAIFGGLALYFAGPGDSELYLVLTLVCLVMGGVTSYARARAEGLGFQAKVGIAERADRLVAILVMTGFCGDLRPADPDGGHPLGAGRRQHDHGGAADLGRPPAGAAQQARPRAAPRMRRPGVSPYDCGMAETQNPDAGPPRRHRHHPRQARHGRDAQGRRDHGRGHRRAGQDRRGRRRGRRDGAGAGARGHPGPGRRVAG